MIEYRKETIETQKEGDDFGFFYEGVYSFYDTDKFLRYDKNLDANEVGNSYESYKASAYTSGVEFLQYADEETIETYVDYALSEQMPDADVEEDESEEEEEEEDSEFDSASAWLLAGSILIAAALLFSVTAVIVRKLLQKRHPRAKKQKKDKKEKKSK